MSIDRMRPKNYGLLMEDGRHSWIGIQRESIIDKPEVTGQQVLSALGADAARFYGYQNGAKKWTVVWNSSPPELFNKLIISRPLINTSKERAASNQQQLAAFLSAVDARSKALGVIRESKPGHYASTVVIRLYHS